MHPLHWTFILALFLLAACSASSEKVVLQNAHGKTITCGPYEVYDWSYTETATSLADARLRACVSDYQRQGYERI